MTQTQHLHLCGMFIYLEIKNCMNIIKFIKNNLRISPIKEKRKTNCKIYIKISADGLCVFHFRDKKYVTTTRQNFENINGKLFTDKWILPSKDKMLKFSHIPATNEGYEYHINIYSKDGCLNKKVVGIPDIFMYMCNLTNMALERNYKKIFDKY